MSGVVRYPSSRDLFKELTAGTVRQRYLLMGEEEGEKDKAVVRIMELSFPDERERQISTARFHADNGEIMAAASFVVSPSMFAAERLCVLYNIDALSSKKDDQRALVEILEAPPENARLIMTTAERKPPAAIAKHLDGVMVVQFWRYFDRDMINYVRIAAKKMGREIEDRAIESLMDLTGNDIRRVDAALELIRYAADAGTITHEMVRAVVNDVREVSMFDYLNALFGGKAIALKLLKRMREDGNAELVILHMITRQAEMLESYHRALDGGATVDEALAKAGVTKRNRDAFWEQVQRFPPSRLRKLYSHIAAADFQLKSGKADAEDFIASPLAALTASLLFDDGTRS